LKIIKVDGGKPIDNQIPLRNEISEEVKVISTGEKSMELGNFLVEHKYHFRIVNEGGYLAYILLPLPEKEMNKSMLRMINMLCISVVLYTLLVPLSMLYFLGLQQVSMALFDALISFLSGIVLSFIFGWLRKRMFKEGGIFR
jgi:hypothetical protein